jgi:hypothetical protein
MELAPDIVKSLACLNVHRVQRTRSFHCSNSYQRPEQTLDTEHKQTPTHSVCNELSNHLCRHVLAGLYLPASSADSAPQGRKRDCTFAKHFRTKFPEGDMDYYGFKTGFLKHPHCLFTLPSKQKGFLVKFSELYRSISEAISEIYTAPHSVNCINVYPILKTVF